VRGRGISTTARPASPTAPANAQRHPTVSASAGTARPPSTDVNGTAACFTPKARPRRPVATRRSSSRLAADCMVASMAPASASMIARLHSDLATAATSAWQSPAPMAAARMVRAPPRVSASRPAGAAATAAAR
jgi:hypothetical protein